MKNKYRWNIKKFMSNLIVVISVLFVIWVLLSWVDISIHNLSENPTYLDFNFFKLIIENL